MKKISYERRVYESVDDAIAYLKQPLHGAT